MHIDKKHHTKLDAKSEEGVLVGYDSHTKGYQVFLRDTRKVRISIDVRFDESAFPYADSTEPSVPSYNNPLDTLTWDSIPIPGPLHSNFSSSSSPPVPLTPGKLSPADSSVEGEIHSMPSLLPPSPGSPSSSTGSSLQVPAHEPLRLSTRTRFHSTKLRDFVGFIEIQEPYSFAEAQCHPGWRLAMEHEFRAISDKETWNLVELPHGANLLETKWIYKVKRGTDGLDSKLKARLIVQGFKQIAGEDYDETFAPVVKWCTIHMVTYCATNNFSVAHLLGSGGFGEVYQWTFCDDSHTVAVKRMKHDSKQGEREFSAEISLISQIRHRNLVQILGWCRENNQLLLVYEYMSNNNLDVWLFDSMKGAKLTWNLRYNILGGLAAALVYLHEEWEQCIVHCASRHQGQ